MAEGQRPELDFKILEEDVLKAMMADTCKSLENDAKIRAVTQGVATYDQFRQIVKGARLKPVLKLQNTDDMNPSTIKSDFCCGVNNLCGSCCKDRGGRLELNSDCARLNPLAAFKRLSIQSQEIKRQLDQALPETEDVEFLPSRGGRTKEELRRMMPLKDDPKELFRLLKTAGSAELGQAVLDREIPARFLGKLIEALLNFRQDSVQEICFVVRVLFRITKSERFIDVLDLRTSSETALCSLLFSKLESCLNGQQQDLAENGVTEWTLIQLRKLYRV